MNKTEKTVERMRAARAKLSAAIEGMTLKKELEWLASQEMEDPFSRRLRDRAAQKSDVA